MVASSEVLPQPSPSSDKSGETSVFTGYSNKQSIKIKKEKKLLLIKSGTAMPLGNGV